jgi:Na+/alanine symporter
MLPAVLLSCAVGAVAAPALVWELTDLLLALMAIINILALLRLQHMVVEETESFCEREGK